MRKVLILWVLSVTFALAKGQQWSEPSKVISVRRNPVALANDVVVPETTQTAEPLSIGGASLPPNYVMTTVDQPRGVFAPGAAEMALGLNRYDESKGKMNVFSWTYAKYTAGLQPERQNVQISPLSRTERPDQASLTYPPPVCHQADASSTDTFSSTESVARSKTKEGSFNVAVAVPLGGPVSASASYNRGWSDTINTYQSFSESGSTTMTKREATSEVLHWRITDVTSLSADFVRNVEDLAEWLPLQNWTSVCEGSGETLEKCAYKGYNSKLRGFVNSFGTDYMNDATFGGKMTSFRGFSTSTAATENKKAVAKSSESSWEVGIEVMPEVDFMEQEAKKAKAATATGQVYSAKSYSKWSQLPQAAEAKGEVAEASGGAPAPSSGAGDEDDKGDGKRRLLFDTPRRIGASAGGSESSSESEDIQSSDERTEAKANSVLKFYGCTPQKDPIAWCSSCAKKPVAIRYQTVPLSNLISEVLKLTALAKRVETYIEDEYQVGCLPGWEWNKLNGECEKAQRCPKGTSVTLGEVTTEVKEAAEPADGECICDCVGTTHPDLIRTFVLMVNGSKVTEEAQCRSDYAEFPQCHDGRVYLCRPKSSSNTVAIEQFYESVAIKSEGCNETVKGLTRSTVYNCQNPKCNIDRPCQASTAIDGKGLNPSCGCPIEFTYEHCRADNTWFSCGNPNCMQNYPVAAINDTTRCPFTQIEAINNCWCGEQSSEWRRCDSDQSWFLERQPSLSDDYSSNAMAKECIGKRMCASDNSLFGNACSLKGFPCNVMHETPSLEVENQNQICFSAATGGLTAFTCAACAPGKFSAAVNNQQCEDCPVGKYSDTPGASECTACQDGRSGYKCQDKVVPYDAQVTMGSSQDRLLPALLKPCQSKNGQAYKGCYNLDNGPLGRELKNGDKCDLMSVALPAGVGIKFYSFTTTGYWPTGTGTGQKSCCITNSTFDDPGKGPAKAGVTSSETCASEDDDLPVEYLGKLLPLDDAPAKLSSEDLAIHQRHLATELAASDTSDRRLLGSGNYNLGRPCLYNAYLLEGYECAPKAVVN